MGNKQNGTFGSNTILNNSSINVTSLPSNIDSTGKSTCYGKCFINASQSKTAFLFMHFLFVLILGLGYQTGSSELFCLFCFWLYGLNIALFRNAKIDITLKGLVKYSIKVLQQHDRLHILFQKLIKKYVLLMWRIVW